MINTRVRAIIPYENGLVLIHRIRTTAEGTRKDYFVFPGGGLEEQDASLEECVEREVQEEIGIKVKARKHLYTVSSDSSCEHFYLCEYVSGEIGTGKGPEFTDDAYKSRGVYITEVVPVENISRIDLLQKVRDALVEDLAQSHVFENINYRELK